MAGHLRARGFVPTETAEDADLLVLNTCTVRQHAEDKALSYIGRLRAWKEKKKPRKIIVAGCAAERLKKNLRHRFNHIDLVAGAKSIDQFPQLLDSLFSSEMAGKGTVPKGTVPFPAVGTVPTAPTFNWFEESENSFENGSLRSEGEPLVLGDSDQTAFVTIMRGCNYSCSYCIVPSVRGREIYRDKDIILNEIKEKIGNKSREVMLLGQTVNSYWHRPRDGSNSIYDFSDLLRDVEKINGVASIKFMSPHPHYMSEKLILTIEESKKISSQIHLPAQSGSNEILKRMRRNYSREEYIQFALKLARARKDLQLSTDFIVGFPGESDADFAQTLDLIDKVKFSMAFCFKYSTRPGTESSAFKDDIPTEVKEERLSQLLKKLETSRVIRDGALFVGQIGLRP